MHMPGERKGGAGGLPLIQGNGFFVIAIPKVVRMAFLRDFLIAKEGISKEVGVLPCPANNVVLNYRVTKVGKEGPFRLPRVVILCIPVLPVMRAIILSGLQRLWL